jgi:2-dehydro-3-deoxyphosphogluconate aldolase/(4S)-4-hydroxy-2-oxoglutarate aldolase
MTSFAAPEQAALASRALLLAGLDVVEVTMRTDAAIDSIRRIKSELPDMLVGAGTVLTLGKAKEAVGAGASFIVMPGFQEDIVDWCVKQEIPVMPGCATPTEIMAAMRHGVSVIKVFPTDAMGGVKAIRALAGPFGPYGVKFVPTGGVDSGNLAEYLREPSVAAVGGGWLCSQKMLKAGDYEGITQTAKEAIAILKAARPDIY